MTFNFWGLRRTDQGYVPFVTVGLDFKNNLLWYTDLSGVTHPEFK